MLYILSFLWFIRVTKAILFWLCLWQLKEYHVGRFLDHFRTEKGKKLLFNLPVALKIALFFVFLALGRISLEPGFFDAVADFILLFSIFIFFSVYLVDGIKVINNYVLNKLSKPVFTKKIQFLILVLLVFTFGFLFFILRFSRRPLLGLLAFDIFVPFVVSLTVLTFQPLTVLWRNQIIKKAREKRAKFKDLLVIGITGSYGKTSTKEFLTTILSKKYRVLKTKAHQNSEVGISQCILNELKEEHEIFVCEMGAYNRGGIKLLCDIIKPKIGIITGVNEQHLATFGSMENILRAEGGEELIEGLPGDGLAIFNGNNKYCQELYQKTKISKKICNANREAAFNILQPDVRAGDVKVEKEWLFFEVFSKDKDFAEFKVNLIGAQNIENILLAVACAKELGITLGEISKATSQIRPDQGGIKLKREIGEIDVLDSTYSANPDSVLSHLEHLKLWPGKKVIIMPCLIELGKASKEVHQRIGEKIGKICNLAIITTKDRFRELREGAQKSGMSKEKILFIKEPDEIFQKIKTFCQQGDVVLLESRVPKNLLRKL